MFCKSRASLPPHLLSYLNSYRFATKFPVESIRNTNLKFEADDYYINMYPFYPQVYKKKEKNIYEVSHSSTVLAFTFLNKNLVIALVMQDYAASWEERKTISFRFKEITKLLTAEVGSGR